jgi:hypothetical protein
MGADYTGKFRLYRRSDWEKLPAMRWLIKSLIARHGTTILYGQPKIGKKSFIGISMACAIATGKQWCGIPTQKAKVLYVVGEGFYGILRRQAAWEKLHGCSVGDNLRYFRVPVNFFSEVEVIAALKALKDQGFEPDFIVIDTLARSMSGGNENDTGDMSCGPYGPYQEGSNGPHLDPSGPLTHTDSCKTPNATETTPKSAPGVRTSVVEEKDDVAAEALKHLTAKKAAKA